MYCIVRHVHDIGGRIIFGVCCSHHMIYNKIAKPIDDDHLERLNGILAAKMEQSVIINEDVLNSWKKAN